MISFPKSEPMLETLDDPSRVTSGRLASDARNIWSTILFKKRPLFDYKPLKIRGIKAMSLESLDSGISL